MSTRVIIADDQKMVRAGFRVLLEMEPDIEIVGEAENGVEAVSISESIKPDIILMDIQMPVMDGLEATRQIVNKKETATPRVIILTTFERDEYIFEALRLGASGFVLKNAPPEDLISAIRVVAEGDALLTPSVTRRVIAEFAKRPVATNQRDIVKKLTEREIQVLQLISKGNTNAEIADELIVSEATVKTHVSNLFTKLNLRDRVQAVVFAYENSLT
jgi:DNA-binding NarL/FixJ family response regulator